MSEIKVNKISPRTNCGTTTLGDSGDTFTIPAGVSIESASYIEKSEDLNSNITTPEASEPASKYSEEEYTPKLFSEDQNQVNTEIKDLSEDNEATEQLFDQETNEDEDFEIPAFLRRQKF